MAIVLTHRRALVSASILCVVGVVLAIPVSLLYRSGKQLEGDRVFLKNDRSPNEYETESHIKMSYVLGSEEPNDVIFLGDSTCLFGISPVQFDALTGLRSYNLGFPGMQGAQPLILVFRRYLEHHPKPRAVVVCAWPLVLDGPQAEPATYERFMWCYGHGDEWPRPTHTDEIREYARAGGRHLLGQITGGLTHHLDEPLQGFAHPDATYNKIAADRQENRGFYQLREGSWKKLVFKGVRTKPDTISAANRVGYDVLAEECRAKGIALVIRLGTSYVAESPPESPDIETWGREFESKHSNVTVSRPVVLLFPREWMADSSHVNEAGTRQLTALVADEVKRALAKATPR